MGSVSNGPCWRNGRCQQGATDVPSPCHGTHESDPILVRRTSLLLAPVDGESHSTFCGGWEETNCESEMRGCKSGGGCDTPRRECMCDVVGRHCAFGVSLWGERRRLPCTRQFRETCQDAGGARGRGTIHNTYAYAYILCWTPKNTEAGQGGVKTRIRLARYMRAVFQCTQGPELWTETRVQ